MGGAFWEGGNVTPHAEFNAYCDPEAAAQIFENPFPNLTVIGLDVTHRTVLRRAVWEAAARGTDGASRLVVEVCRQAFADRALQSVYLHDPLAVAVALDPTLVTCEEAAVDVVLFGEELGQTRIVGPGPLRVARTVAADRFVTEFTAALGLPSTA